MVVLFLSFIHIKITQVFLYRIIGYSTTFLYILISTGRINQIISTSDHIFVQINWKFIIKFTQVLFTTMVSFLYKFIGMAFLFIPNSNGRISQIIFTLDLFFVQINWMFIIKFIIEQHDLKWLYISGVRVGVMAAIHENIFTYLHFKEF